MSRSYEESIKIICDGVEELLNVLRGLDDKKENTTKEKAESVKVSGKKAKKQEAEDEWEEEEAVEETADDEGEQCEATKYESMTAQELYKLCGKRGISGKLKSRKKVDLIKALKDNDKHAGDEPEEDEADDWGDEDETPVDPYAGKSAKELYTMCKERKIKAEQKKKPDYYANLLKKDDEKKAKTSKQAEPEEDEDDDDWEI